MFLLPTHVPTFVQTPMYLLERLPLLKAYEVPLLLPLNSTIWGARSPAPYSHSELGARVGILNREDRSVDRRKPKG